MDVFWEGESYLRGISLLVPWVALAAFPNTHPSKMGVVIPVLLQESNSKPSLPSKDNRKKRGVCYLIFKLPKIRATWVRKQLPGLCVSAEVWGLVGKLTDTDVHLPSLPTLERHPKDRLHRPLPTGWYSPVKEWSHYPDPLCNSGSQRLFSGDLLLLTVSAQSWSMSGVSIFYILLKQTKKLGGHGLISWFTPMTPLCLGSPPTMCHSQQTHSLTFWLPERVTSLRDA